jgi:hypothetical protein
MRRSILLVCARLATLAVTAAAPATALGAGMASGANLAAAGPPPGFEELARPREIVVDIFFGGKKRGEAVAVSRPGFLHFRDPAAVAALVPDAADPAALASAFAGDLDTHSELVCSAASSPACGSLPAGTDGIIFDEQHFRVDLFVKAADVRPSGPINPYLPAPSAVPSLTSSLGLAVSGTTGSSPVYDVQNRTIAALGPLRFRADTSYASHFGLLADDLVAELDRPGLRYSAGLFWAPGLDLTGQRRIAGIGIGTQFDTRLDRDSLRGTPLLLFLNQPARVEFLIDGRLVASGLYPAGNNQLDTSSLPDGAYPIVLRIREASGAVHDEQRFFTKNAQIAPVGKPIYFAYAGMLANTRPYSLVSLSKSIYYQVGTARRLSRGLAVDLSVVGTDRKAMVETGAWVITRVARARLAALASTSGDRALLFQLGSASFNNLSFNFDLRRIWSHNGNPLLPAPDIIDDFRTGQPVTAQLGTGSYTQATGSLSYQVGAALFSVIASYRKDQGSGSDFSIGPSAQWLVLNRPGLQLSLEADAQRTRSTRSAFFGIRLLHTGGSFSTSSTSGYRNVRSLGAGGSSAGRLVTSTTGQYYHEGSDRTQVAVSGGFDRTTDLTSVHADTSVYSQLGTVKADLLHDFGGPLQYGVSLETGAAADPRDFAVGGREVQESAIVVKVESGDPQMKYEVLVDEQPLGQISGGGELPLFLEPYRLYKVRLRPVGAASVWYDAETREVTLYPGTVKHLSWRVEPLATLFGRAVRPDGSPLSDASVQSRRGVGETDGNGYFQIDSTSGDTLLFTSADGTACRIGVGELRSHVSFVSMGKLVCQ